MIINEFSSPKEYKKYWNSVPKIFYKYRDWGNCYQRSIIEQNVLWFSSPKGLNDPYDCQLPLIPDIDEINSDSFFEFIKTGFDSEESANNKWNEIKQDPQQYFFKNRYHLLDAYLQFGIVSLCEEADNFLLWSHYANAHKGFCVGFNAEKLVREYSCNCTLDKVSYQDNFPKFRFTQNLDDSLQVALTTKHSQWSYEKEWRMIKIHTADKEIEFGSDALSEVYLGTCMEEKNRSKMIDIVRSKGDHIKIYEMRLSQKSFRIEPILLEQL